MTDTVNKQALYGILNGIRNYAENMIDDLSVDNNGSFELSDYADILPKLNGLITMFNPHRQVMISPERMEFYRNYNNDEFVQELLGIIDKLQSTPSTPVQGYLEELTELRQIIGMDMDINPSAKGVYLAKIDRLLSEPADNARADQGYREVLEEIREFVDDRSQWPYEAEVRHQFGLLAKKMNGLQALSQTDIQPSGVHPWDLLERDGVKAVVELNVIYGEDFGGHEAMIQGVYGNFEPHAMGDFLKVHHNGIHLKQLYDAAGKDGDSWTIYAALEEVPEEKQYGTGYGDILTLPGYYHLGKVLGVVKHEPPGINSTEDDQPGPSISSTRLMLDGQLCGVCNYVVPLDHAQIGRLEADGTRTPYHMGCEGDAKTIEPCKDCGHHRKFCSECAEPSTEEEETE